jgi:hypothetical protein
MITTVQLLALLLATWAAQACSASYCSAGTMVSRRSLPLTTGCRCCPRGGSAGRSVAICTCSLPARPASSELYSSSMPAAPTRAPWLLVPVKPMMLAASVTVRVRPGVARGHRDAGQVEGLDLVAHLRRHALGQHHVLR